MGYGAMIIGKKMGKDWRTIKKHFGDILEEVEPTKVMADGADEYIADVVFGRVEVSPRDRLTACFFVRKTKGGDRETVRSEHTGADGAPLVQPVLNVAITDRPESSPSSGEGVSEQSE
jgi:hypothetical protein